MPNAFWQPEFVDLETALLLAYVQLSVSYL